MTVLISVTELANRIDTPAATRPLVLDVRWALGDPDGRAHYREAHVPGAVYVDLETELAGRPSPEAGRHPLPTPDALQAAARRWGVHYDRGVVVYDDVAGTSAARAWWLLRWASLRDVRLLDGGLGAWRAAGHPVESGDVTPAPSDVTLRPGGMPTVSADEAARIARDGVLLDARAAARYRGEEEPVDPVAGHIPGAVSAPTTGNVGPDGQFLRREDLVARFAALGISPGSEAVAAYCGSGVTAAHEVAALAEAGVDAALYPGSWSEWCSDASRPVATSDPVTTISLTR